MSDFESRKGCTVDSCRAVWRFKYGWNQDIVKCEMNEVVRTGSQPAESFFDVVAVNATLAEAAWQAEFASREIGNPKCRECYDEGSRFAVKKLSGPDFVCYIDSEIGISQGWS